MKVVFSEAEGQFIPIIFQTELTQYQYSFIQLLNKLFKFKGTHKMPTSSIICFYIISPFATRECKNYKKLIKIVNIEEENFQIF